MTDAQSYFLRRFEDHCTEIVDVAFNQNGRQGIVIPDTNIFSSFVGGELHCVHGQFDLDELWAMEQHYLALWQGKFFDIDRIAISRATQNELAQGVKRLGNYGGNPRGAITYRWGRDLYHLDVHAEEEVFEKAKDFLGETVARKRNLYHASSVFPARAHVSEKSRRYLPSLVDALNRVRQGRHTPSEGFYRTRSAEVNRDNDVSILADAFAISYEKPVTVFTRDKGLRRLHEGFYVSLVEDSSQFDFPQPIHPVVLVHRDTTMDERRKTTYLLHPNGVLGYKRQRPFW